MGDIENYQFKKNYFDITMSLGVIAHVPNQKQMFKKMVQATKNDGFLILGYVEDAGLIQRLLHRSIIKVNSNESESKTFELAMKVFGEHIKRSVEFGGRSAEAIINDYLINPEYHGLSSIKLNEWAQEYGLKLYSSYPNTNIPFGIDSPYSENISRNNMIYQRYLSICRLRFIFAQLTDDEVFSKFFKNLDNLSQKIEESIKTLNHILQNFDFTYKNLEKQREQWKKVTEDYKKYAELKVIETHEELIVMVDELLRVLELISDKNNKNKSFLLKKITKRLFKGYNGLATSYTIWHKSV